MTAPTMLHARRRLHVDARLAGVLLVLASACGYGSGSLFAKPVYADGVDWLTLLFWRFLIAAVISWAWLLLVPGNRASLRLLTRRRVAVLVALGIFFVSNSGTYYAALETVPASLAALIVYLYPALVAVLALRFGRRLEGRRAWLALGISTAGVALAVGGIPEVGAPPLLGLALTVASPVLYAVWIIMAARLGGERPQRRPRRYGERAAPETASSTADASVPSEAAVSEATMPPADSAATPERARATDSAPTAAVLTTTTAVTYLLGMLLTGHSISPAAIPGNAWFGLIGIAIVSTALAVQAFYAGARRVGAARASLISTVEPIYTIVLASILFHESLAPIQLLGGALIISGVLLAESGRGGEHGVRSRRPPSWRSLPGDPVAPRATVVPRVTR